MNDADPDPTAPDPTDDDARGRELQQLASRLGHRFADIALLERALCHSSTGNEGRDNYERLEFLGDAILGFLVADSLFHTTPEIPEGALTDRRARIVSRAPLAAVANSLQLGRYLVGGRGLQERDRQSPRILADLVEAVVAAIYIDGGIEPARRFVRRHVLAADNDLPRPTERDAKSRLLHFAQIHEMGQPRYELDDAWGPDHDLRFRVTVIVGEERVADGSGRTKQAAEKQAAARALQLLQQRRRESGQD